MKTKRKITTIICILICALAMTSTAYGHGGRTDSSGATGTIAMSAGWDIITTIAAATRRTYITTENAHTNRAILQEQLPITLQAPV